MLSSSSLFSFSKMILSISSHTFIFVGFWKLMMTVLNHSFSITLMSSELSI